MNLFSPCGRPLGFSRWDGLRGLTDGWCAHMLTVQASAENCASDGAFCIRVMAECGHLACDCSAVCLWLAKVVSLVATTVEKIFPEKQFPSNPLKAEHRQLASGRRKIAEEYRRAIVLKAQSDSRGIASTDALREDKIRERNFRLWCNKESAAELVALRRSMASDRPGVIGICEDGSRLGNPGEDRIVYCAMRIREKVSGFLLPQAP